MRTITLDELVDRAALQTRVDRKYIVPSAQVLVLLAALDSTAEVLEIDGQQSFGYESVYFDTPGLDSFYGAAHRRRRRFKVRTRTYTDSGDCYLEVKTEGARSATVKERLEHADSPDEIGAAGVEYARSVLAEAGIRADVSVLTPVLSTSYRRRTLYLPASQSRATIDTQLAWELHSRAGAMAIASQLRDASADGAALRRLNQIRLPELAIVETKSGSTASSVDRLLWTAGHRPSSISKYATGMAAFRPDLPSNKWAPILRNHFVSERAAS